MSANCPLDRLANLATVRAPFHWGACDIDVPGCLQLKHDPAFSYPAKIIYHGLHGYDDGNKKWILLDYGSPTKQENIALVARYDGVVVAGYRTRDRSETGCYPRAGSMGLGHVALSYAFPSIDKIRLVTGALSEGGGLALSPEIPSFGAPYPEVGHAWLPGRVSLWWQGGRIDTFDWKDGTDQRFLAFSSKLGGFLEYPTATKDRIVSSVFSQHDFLVASDGLTSATVLYKDPDASIIKPRFDGTHLVWIRCLNLLPPPQGYDACEVWASLPATSQADFKPFYVGPYPYIGPNATLTAGHGYLYGTEAINGADLRSIYLYQASTGTRRRYTLPKTHLVNNSTAVLHDEVLMTARLATDDFVSRYYRIPIASIPVQPFN
jgi:hypothetical protein